jgi:uncharacterized protein
MIRIYLKDISEDFDEFYFGESNSNRRVHTHIDSTGYVIVSPIASDGIFRSQDDTPFVPTGNLATSKHVLNPFVHKLDFGEMSALFNTVTLSIVYLKKIDFTRVVAQPPQRLIESDFFINLEQFSAPEYLQRNIKRELIEPEIGLVYFVVTPNCNMDCKYCMLKAKNHSGIIMSREVAQRGINLIQRNTSKVNVIFYGGEPLLNFDIIQYVVRQVAESDIDANFHIVTNGTLINSHIVSFIQQYDIRLTVSIDGYETTHDAMRVDSYGRGTFSRVYHNLLYLKDQGVPFGLSCTLLSETDYQAQEIINLVREFDVKSFGCNR